ncbi:hypothetical protein QQF64_020269 [Cirrhinus molitorella]|uniref:Uncharacterized protein n=1 Tax=Cirrhinus molitorella TaxID=172907 RepID=A0ABR3LC70_9TELE
MSRVLTLLAARWRNALDVRRVGAPCLLSLRGGKHIPARSRFVFTANRSHARRGSRPGARLGFCSSPGVLEVSVRNVLFSRCLCSFQMCVFLQALVISPDAHLRRRPITTSRCVILRL